MAVRLGGKQIDDVLNGFVSAVISSFQFAVWLASPAAAWLGAAHDRAGRVSVQPDLTLPGHPEIFVIGDAAAVAGSDGKPVPGPAPVAKQQGPTLRERCGCGFPAGRLSRSAIEISVASRPSAADARLPISAGCTCLEASPGCCGGSCTSLS